MKARIRVLLRIFAGTSIARRGRSPSLPQEREREKREEKERRERGRERASARKTDRQAGRKEWMQRRGCDTRMLRQAEPKLAKYFESDAYKLPVNNPGATPYFF